MWSKSPVILSFLPVSHNLHFCSYHLYMPLGQFSASIVRLALDWTLDELDWFRNRIRFYFSRKGERSLHIEFRSLSTHLELRILLTGPEPINPRMILECRSELWKVFCEVASSYPHTRNVKWRYDFYCPRSLRSGGRPHPARCLIDEPQDVVCSQPGCGVLFLLRTSTSVGSQWVDNTDWLMCVDWIYLSQKYINGASIIHMLFHDYIFLLYNICCSAMPTCLCSSKQVLSIYFSYMYYYNYHNAKLTCTNFYLLLVTCKWTKHYIELFTVIYYN